ncbi:hypothetical protein [Gordonia paraffinivorans]|uniref:hypothetical protein n=1 Tax=Gordonia paraffinivorans TaxID=175628 RepID=UPI0014482A64|nr:hypothetical protein [Gordonia paraffinivorans]
MTTPAAPHRPKKYALISGVALVVIAVIVGVVFAVRAATGDAPRWSDPSADTLPDLSSAPEDPRWTFDLGQGFWFPRFIGGNENVVALGARRHDAPAAVAFLDAGTGERLAQVDSPDDRTEFRSCAIAESDASAACLVEGLTDDGQAVVFADLGNGSIRRSVPAADRAIVVAHRDRFFVVPERSARSRIEVYDREGGLAATLPYGEVYTRSGLVVSREEAGRDTERLVVRSMTTLAEVFRQEPRKVGHTGANPFPGGFAVDTDSGVDYFDSDGNPTTTVRGARLERAAPGGVLSTRFGPAGESILPILTDRDTTGNEKPLFVASPMSGKTLWRWMFDHPVVVFSDGGTVVIKRGGDETEGVFDVSTGAILADHLNDADLLGSDGRRVLVSAPTAGGHQLEAIDGAETLWEYGPYASDPVVIAGKVYADTERLL